MRLDMSPDGVKNRRIAARLGAKLLRKAWLSMPKHRRWMLGRK